MARVYDAAMTIDKHLDLSVLSAPLASVDRRSLSQAWYSALYGSNAPAAQPPGKPGVKTPAGHERAASGTPVSQRVRSQSALPAPKASKQSSAAGGGDAERRAPRTALSRRIERTLRSGARTPLKAAFTLESSGARVQLLVRGCGPNLRLVAICPPRITPQVAVALVQVRYALALRGVRAETSARESSQC